MRRVQAWERLNDVNYCAHLTMGELYDLMLRAGYPVEEAQKAASQRGLERLDAEMIM